MDAFRAALAWLFDGTNWSENDGLAQQLVEQVLLTLTSLGIAAAVALPLALWLGHLGRGGILAVNVSNIGRAVPTFAVLVLLSVGPLGSDRLGPYGRAGLATLVSLMLFALPPIITNAYVGMREIDREIVEAARGMGMTGWELFRRVELPLALPLILTGLRLALVQVWATATIAALVAGPGLGNTIAAGFDNNDSDRVIGGAIVVALIALAMEGAAALVERQVDPVRRARRVSVRRTPAAEALAA
ncbi:MAG: ABC transporter permease [Actinomycetota bacterium]|nr:ABC transporter permease [Actinomycetota bacterium]